MAKLSLSGAMGKRKRIRVMTALAVLLLLFFGISMMVSKNPKGTKAGGITWLFGADYLFASDVYCALSNTSIVNNVRICNAGSSTVFNQNQPDNDIVFDGGTASHNYQFIMRGSFHFKSLKIQNYAVVTHEALVAGTDFSATAPFGLINNGPTKQVDLQIDGDLTLDTGGKIDVTGEGYPGGAYPGPGYGPGATNALFCNTWCSSGGAGFGGVGGTDNGGTGGLTYPNINPPIGMLPGSGAGGTHGNVNDNDNTYSLGGYGGGRIILQVSGIIRFNSNSSYISANGTPGVVVVGQNDGNASAAGSGSGGSIWIEAGSVQYSPAPYTGYAAISSKGQANGGQPGEVSVSVGWKDINAFYNISADGGIGMQLLEDTDGDGNRGNTIIANGGGGGRIVINKIIVQLVTIKKTLVAVNRNNASPVNTLFNPYALQKGDRIQVNFDVTNLIPGTLTLTDEMLKVPYNAMAYCKYRSDTLNVGAIVNDPATDTEKLVWNYTVVADDAGEKSFSYQCDVQ